MTHGYLKGLGLPAKLKLHELTELLCTHFYYEEERGILFLKKDLRRSIRIDDFKILLSELGVQISSQTDLPTALGSERVSKVRWLDIAVKRLPKWDGTSRIELLASHFMLTNESQRGAFNTLFRFWLIKSAEMVLKPNEPEAVNRLVFCVQSDAQGIGKTTFGRLLCSPFDQDKVPSVYEMETPEFHKDAKIQLATNFLVILDDINTWHASGLKKLKPIISSKTIKVRPPYGQYTIAKPRTASFFGTTNEEGFLNEKNDTRWAVFSIQDIDKQYNFIDMRQLWAEVFQLAQISSNVLITDEIKQLCIGLSSGHQIKTDLTEILLYYFEPDEESGNLVFKLYSELPEDVKRMIGTGKGALSVFGKALSRVFPKELKYGSGGFTKWKLKRKWDFHE